MKEEHRKTLEYFGPKPFHYVQMVNNFLSSEFGNPKESRIGYIKQLIYQQNGTTITFEIHDVGPSLNGIEGKVKLHFFSEKKENIDEMTSRGIWKILELSNI